MTLLITVFAAVSSSIAWYRDETGKYNLAPLLCMFWGASLMWLVDAIFEFAELKDEFFTPDASDMVNDTFLGLCVVALALVIWFVMLVVKDPSGRIKKAITRS